MGPRHIHILCTSIAKLAIEPVSFVFLYIIDLWQRLDVTLQLVVIPKVEWVTVYLDFPKTRCCERNVFGELNAKEVTGKVHCQVHSYALNTLTITALLQRVSTIVKKWTFRLWSNLSLMQCQLYFLDQSTTQKVQVAQQPVDHCPNEKSKDP